MRSCTSLKRRHQFWLRKRRGFVPDTTVIVGLGNPGPRYANTRHNVGWKVLDIVSANLQIPLNERRPKAVLGTGYHSGKRIVLAKPRTFMNNSGEAVEYLLARFGGGGGNLLVIYDEMALLPAATLVTTAFAQLSRPLVGPDFLGCASASAPHRLASWPASMCWGSSRTRKQRPFRRLSNAPPMQFSV